MIYFTSDYHLGHSKLLLPEYDNRPFKTIEEHDDTIIRNHNSLVKNNDTIYFLGDFSLTNSRRTKEYIERLSGNLILIRGNHDDSMSASNRSCFQNVYHYREIKIDNQLIIMSHYPFHSWRKMSHGSIMLHGHTHGNDNYDKSRKILNVGVNINNYKPISFEEIKIIMDNKLIKEYHHNRKLRISKQENTNGS